MDNITKEEFYEWKQDKVTKAFLGHFRNEIEVIKDELVGAYQVSDFQYVKLVAMCQAFKQVEDVDYKDLGVVE